MPVHWADVSYYQPAVNDSYPHPVLCIRSNDGTFRDPKFAQNYSWARRAMDSGRLDCLIVYCVYRPNWQATADTMISMVGNLAHARVVAMIDVESWGGQIQGDHSVGINALHARLASWLGDRRRVIGYGNRGDLNSLWPRKPPGVALIVAAYSARRPAAYPGMFGHQFSSSHPCPPFGPCDGNVAYDHDRSSLLALFGLGGTQRPRGILPEETDDLQNILIRDTGRMVLGCPTGSQAENGRRAWLSAIVLDLKGKAWVQVYAQGANGGTGTWLWTDDHLRARPDNLLPRAVSSLPDNTSHLIVSWDIRMAPEGGTLLLETRPAT